MAGHPTVRRTDEMSKAVDRVGREGHGRSFGEAQWGVLDTENGSRHVTSPLGGHCEQDVLACPQQKQGQSWSHHT